MENQYSTRRDFLKQMGAGLAGLTGLFTAGALASGCQTKEPSIRYNPGEFDKTVSLQNIRKIELIESIKESNENDLKHEWGFSCVSKNGNDFYIGPDNPDYEKACEIYKIKENKK